MLGIKPSSIYVEMEAPLNALAPIISFATVANITVTGDAGEFTFTFPVGTFEPIDDLDPTTLYVRVIATAQNATGASAVGPAVVAGASFISSDGSATTTITYTPDVTGTFIAFTFFPAISYIA